MIMEAMEELREVSWYLLLTDYVNNRIIVESSLHFFCNDVTMRTNLAFVGFCARFRMSYRALNFVCTNGYLSINSQQKTTFCPFFLFFLFVGILKWLSIISKQRIRVMPFSSSQR